MHKNDEVLDTVYQNAEMGRDGVARLMKSTDDTNFRKTLENQQQSYQNVIDSAEQLYQEQNKKPDSAGPVQEAASWALSNIKTTIDNSPSHIAAMLIKGYTVANTEITRQAKSASDCDPKVLALSNQMSQTIQTNIEEMKQFL